MVIVLLYHSKWFELRSVSSLYYCNSMIVQVRVVLIRTLLMTGILTTESHLQSQVNSVCQSVIGQFSHDGIG